MTAAVRPHDDASALSDAALVAAMRAGDRRAWMEFDLRFRPALERYAACIGLPTASWPECVSDVVTDAAIRFASAGAVVPESCLAYLIRAVRNRATNLSRQEARAMRISEQLPPHTHPAASGPRDGYGSIAERLREGLSPDQELLLAWVAENVPYRQIAEWLGIGYEATAKRIARLNARLRVRIENMTDDATDAERDAISALLRSDGPSRRR